MTARAPDPDATHGETCSASEWRERYPRTARAIDDFASGKGSKQTVDRARRADKEAQ